MQIDSTPLDVMVLLDSGLGGPCRSDHRGRCCDAHDLRRSAALAAHTGANTSRRGERVDDKAVWTIPELQDLLDEWLIAGWQHRPHDSLRNPYFPRRAMSPNDKYASLVAAAGYLPLTLTGEDYLELLPVAWRAINDCGIDRVGVLDDRRLSSGRCRLILPDGQQRTVAGDVADDELASRYQLDKVVRMPLAD